MIHNRPKRTISVSGGLELLQLQMVSESDNKDARPPRKVDCEMAHIDWREEQNISYRGKPLSNRLTTLRNGLKWTMSASGGLGQLQMGSKSDTERQHYVTG